MDDEQEVTTSGSMGFSSMGYEMPINFEEEVRRVRQRTIDRENSKVNSTKELEKESKFKVGDYVICVKSNRPVSNYHWKEGLVFQVRIIYDNSEKKDKSNLIYEDICGRQFNQDLLQLATRNDIKRYEKKVKLDKFVDNKFTRIRMEEEYKAMGKDPQTIDKLALDHPDSQERRRKHHPPTDEKGLTEQDLEL